MDEDIDTPSILRFSPERPLKKVHKLQFIYAWFFYGIMTIFWMTAKDWMALARYRKVIKSSGFTESQLVRKMIVSKALYFGYIIGLPLIFSGMSFQMILAGWTVMHAVTGMTLACIFQPAHVLEDVQFAQAEAGGKMKTTHTFRSNPRPTSAPGRGYLRGCVAASITRLNTTCSPTFATFTSVRLRPS